jgi:hypothetical protein
VVIEKPDDRSTPDDDCSPMPLSGKWAPGVERTAAPPQAHRQVRQARRVWDVSNAIEAAASFITDYVVLPDDVAFAVACWVAAAHLHGCWDRFPHLSINSPEKRCGKTTLLEVLTTIVPSPLFTSNISPAALFRMIAKEHNTLLFDEAQSLLRRGSESSEVMLEILNAGITRNASVRRCGSKRDDYQVEAFGIYSPKVFALIGTTPSVLADRSLPVHLERRLPDETVLPNRSRIRDPRGAEVKNRLVLFASEYEDTVIAVYNALDGYDLANARMADLLMPLQAVASIDGTHLDLLERYALSLDERDRDVLSQSDSVKLLHSLRGLFGDTNIDFFPTTHLRDELNQDETWRSYNYGRGLRAESLAKILSEYKIHPVKKKDKTQARGFYRDQFSEAWERYLPALPSPPSPSEPSTAAPREPA